MAKIRIKELRHVRAGDLVLNEKNWRRHPTAQRMALERVLERVGYADALIARQTPDGLQLIDGHLRAELDPEQVVPVLVTDLSELEADTVLATLDPLAAMAEGDDDALRGLLEGIAEDGDAALRGLLEGLHDVRVEGDAIEDVDAPVEIPGVPVTARGDLWRLGRHRLLCGDASNRDDVERVLDGEKPQLLVTDPPYGVDYQPSWRVEGLGRTSDRTDQVTNDGLEDALALIKATLDVLPPSIIVVYVWHAALVAPDAALVEAGFGLRARIAWVKQTPTLSRGHYNWQHEELAYGVREKKTASWMGGRSQTTVWQITRPYGWLKSDEDSNHPTPKPVECMERPIRNHEGDVFDPFVGSGSTIVAAERQGRACYAIEIEPRYVDAAVRRWEKVTGETAVREPVAGV